MQPIVSNGTHESVNKHGAERLASKTWRGLWASPDPAYVAWSPNRTTVAHWFTDHFYSLVLVFPGCAAVKWSETIGAEIQFGISLMEANRRRLSDCCRLHSSPHRLHKRKRALRDNWQKPSSLCHSFPVLPFLPLNVILVSSPLTQTFVHRSHVK